MCKSKLAIVGIGEVPTGIMPERSAWTFFMKLDLMLR